MKIDIEKEREGIKKVREEIDREKKEHPNENHYKIFRVERDENGKEKKITMTKFWAKDDNAAYAYLKKYVRIANKEYRYYYGTTGNYISSRGNRYDDMHEMMEDPREDLGFWWHFCTPFRNKWFSLRDMYWNFRDFLYRLRTKHLKNESYSLCEHVFDDILFNIPIIKGNSYGCPQEFIDKAMTALNKTEEEKKEGLTKGYGEDVFKLAFKLLHKELDDLKENILLYRYYSSYGIVDMDDHEMVEIDAIYRSTLPYRPGTYKEFDYKRLHDLQRQKWNRIWDWMRKHGDLLST